MKIVLWLICILGVLAVGISWQAYGSEERSATPSSEAGLPPAAATTTAAAAAAATNNMTINSLTSGSINEWLEQIKMRKNMLSEIMGTDSINGKSHSMPAAGSVSWEELHTKLHAEMTATEEIIAEISRWENEIWNESTGGNIESILVKANGFDVERRYRRRLQLQLQKLLSLNREMTASQHMWLEEEMQKAIRIGVTLTSAATRAATEKATAAEMSRTASGIPDESTKFEFYQLKSSATLRQVSALPEVYGNPERWERLLVANRDKVADPELPLPSGTILVVPLQQMKTHLGF